MSSKEVEINLCDGNLDIQEAGNTKVIYVYLINTGSHKELRVKMENSQT